MIRRVSLIIILLLFLSPRADACVGKNLTIGAVSSAEGQVLAEMVCSLINERTGTTVSVKLFQSEQELYEAVNARQIDISIQNTTRAIRLLHKTVDKDPNRAYQFAKTAFEKAGLAWLKPFGFLYSNGDAAPSQTAAVVRVEVLNNFPALPRVIGKLGNTMNDETRTRLVRAAESGEKPRKTARDFLKSKKLI